MKKRSLFLALATGMIVWGFGALEARAGFVPLPTTLDTLLPAGSFTTVAAPNETETFSNFGYSTSPVGSPPAAAGVTVHPFQVGNEAGLTFTGAFSANAGTTVDYAFFYTVTAPKGYSITDASLSGTFNNNGGTGTGSITETLLNVANGAVVGSLAISTPPGGTSDTVLIPLGVNSIRVEKDLILVGGSQGTAISIFNQGFSSTVPEPASLSLMGIGMAGFFAYRRLFKRRTTVA